MPDEYLMIGSVGQWPCDFLCDLKRCGKVKPHQTLLWVWAAVIISNLLLITKLPLVVHLQVLVYSLVAERSEANNRDLWASESQLAFISLYIYIYIIIICLSLFPGLGGQATCSKW